MKYTNNIIPAVFLSLVAGGLVVHAVAFLVAGPEFGSTEDHVYFAGFLILWLLLSILTAMLKALSGWRIAAFVCLFMLLGIIVRGLFEPLVIPLTISMVIWAFADDK